MSGVDSVSMAMTRLSDNEKSGESDSEDKRSSLSPDQSELSSPLPLSSKLLVKTEECEINSEFRIVRLKRPNATAIGGMVSKRRKPNNSEDFKSPDLYSLNSGVLKKIFEGNFPDNEPIMVQVSLFFYFIFACIKIVFILDDYEGEDEGKQASCLSL